MPEIRSYLLGRVSEEQRTRVEERLLTDDDYFEQLQAEEDELIDDYLQDALAWSERRRFVRIFLAAPARRDKLHFARALQHYINPHTHGPTTVGRWSWLFSWWTYLLRRQVSLPYVTALLLVAAAGTWLTARLLDAARPASVELAAVQSERDEMSKQLRAQQDEADRLRQLLAQQHQAGQATPLPISPPTPTSTPPRAVLSFLLSLINVKAIGAPLNTLELPAGIEIVRLTCALEDDGYQFYRATLQIEDEQLIYIWQRARPHGAAGLKQLHLEIPAARLNTETYVLKLEGLALGESPGNVGESAFKVVRK